ncbi:MAG: anti-sigma factor [Pirellulales bacterium]
MRCLQVKDRLSAYLDGELSPQLCAEVEAHLKDCQTCAEELSAFQDISFLATALVDCAAPASMWDELERQTRAVSSAEADTSRQSPVRPSVPWWDMTSSRLVWFRWAAAAGILLSFGYLGYQTWWHQHTRTQMAQVLTEYLHAFQRDPQSAQQVFLLKYGGRAVDVQQATQSVGFQPVVARGVPAGYSIQATYVVDMPCCTCVQCVCVRSDGSKFTIFEHCNTEVGLGDHPTDEMVCHGMPCTMTDVDGQNAATWHKGQRHVTVLGVKDKAELEQLVGWFSDGSHTMAH